MWTTLVIDCFAQCLSPLTADSVGMERQSAFFWGGGRPTKPTYNCCNYSRIHQESLLKYMQQMRGSTISSADNCDCIRAKARIHGKDIEKLSTKRNFAAQKTSKDISTLATTCHGTQISSNSTWKMNLWSAECKTSDTYNPTLEASPWKSDSQVCSHLCVWLNYWLQFFYCFAASVLSKEPSMLLNSPACILIIVHGQK